MRRFLTFPCLLIIILSAPFASAAELPFDVRQAVVWVLCGNRQGSGVVIQSTQGYVLTNAHVGTDLETGTPDSCTVGFVTNSTYEPTTYFEAEVVRSVFDFDTNRDFAILKLGRQKNGTRMTAFPYIHTDEFSRVGDPLSIISFPAKTKNTQFVSTGTITALEQGVVRTNAEISSGSSGGPALNGNNDLVGIAMGIRYRELSSGAEEIIDYQLVDIRAVLTWLDTFGTNAHDAYVIHRDATRYHGPGGYLSPASISCALLARLKTESAVYCLKPDGSRVVFPDAQTFQSWFADFSTVTVVSPTDLANARFSGVVTMKAGSLVKIESDPRVYLVTDDMGTLRWIPDETRARELFGDGWAGFVKDIPVSFFELYRVGPPLPASASPSTGT